jgi:hypothetical protein
MKKYAEGGIYTAEMGQPPMEPDGGSVTPAPKRPMRGMPPESPMMKREGRGMAKADMQKKAPQKMPPKMPGMKKGGSVSARADGIAKKGKTNCKMY